MNIIDESLDYTLNTELFCYKPTEQKTWYVGNHVLVFDVHSPMTINYDDKNENIIDHKGRNFVLKNQTTN